MQIFQGKPLTVEPFGSDPALACRQDIIRRRRNKYLAALKIHSQTPQGELSFEEAAGRAHEFFGLHRQNDGCWVFREWAPAARRIFLAGDFSNFENQPQFELKSTDPAHGIWEITLPAATLRHGMHYQLNVFFADGSCNKRLPAYARCIVQDPVTGIFTAQVYAPQEKYRFRSATPARPPEEIIYEAHIGMAQCEGKVGTFNEFADNVLPRIAAGNYNTIQLMAVMSHPYYGSFGYHVANFFAISSRFGSIDEFKELIDRAHAMGLRVIMDVVHSHAVRNEIEGLARFDGTREQYFHSGNRGEHPAWDSFCFDYGKVEVQNFLLSNLRFYLEEYNIDGFRFDGITSMLYTHHGLSKVFSGYSDYFSDEVDEDACTYLTLANHLVHAIKPQAVTIAEDVSGMPGLAAPIAKGGNGFDLRLAMGVTDYWFKLFDQPDDSWDMEQLFYELTNRRRDERTISYLECHDQAIVGGQSAIFRLAGSDIYTKMRIFDTNENITRAVAIHKLARLLTASSSCSGYLNFMGNEFAHPEWIDFPREGNNWSYHYARRQWHLADDPQLFYNVLNNFDRAMLALLKEHTIWQYDIRKLKVSNTDKVIAFERGNLWLFFNFNARKSYPDYGVEVMPGKYRLLFDSDSERFGGFNRVESGQYYFTIPEQEGNILKHEVKLYLPSRTALVLTKVD
ncbi:MAG: alpha amylase C-terminal domain-containing protein [Lentisphaeria bacterium]|nr:alpha amylase C-terminal domain-containing protein [Lentisphaeria bacterium]